MLTNLIIMATAGVITFLTTPWVKRLARHYDVIDKPDRKRKRHRRLVPLWGGLAVALGLTTAWLMAVRLPQVQLWLSYHGDFLGQRLWIVGLAFLIITVAGLVDDKMVLPPKVKLLTQIVAVLLVVFAGFYFHGFRAPGSEGVIWLWPLAGLMLSCLWMLFMVNAFNFIDGVDGLAASQTFIAGLALSIGGVVAAAQSDNLLAAYQSRLGALIASASAGAALGFYRFNRWPAGLFLGDAGSSLFGFTLCLAGILIMGQAPTAAAPWTVILILAWPMLDTVQVIFRRWRRGEPISKADNRHWHHELQKRGFTKTATVAFINMISIFLSALGLGLLWL